MTILSLAFFDLHIIFSSNEANLLAPIEAIFQRFLIPSEENNGHIRCELLVEQDVLTIVTTGRLTSRVRVANFRPILSLILDRLIFDMISQIDSHIMLHAGMVSIAGTGVAIVADSMQGKTTLTSGLAQFADTRFMSDESAAIQLNQPLVDAFPRAVSIRPKTLDLLNIDPLHAFDYLGKYYLDPETLFGKPICEQVELGAVFVISAENRSQHNKLLLRLNTAPLRLQAQLASLACVQNVRCTPQDGFWTVLCTSNNIHTAYQQATRICAEHGTLILDVQTHSLRKPNFARTPSVTPLSRAAAALQLLHHFQAGLHSTLITERYAGDESKLFLALLRNLAKAECYQLTIGTLDETIDLVRKTCQR